MEIMKICFIIAYVWNQNLKLTRLTQTLFVVDMLPILDLNKALQVT